MRVSVEREDILSAWPIHKFKFSDKSEKNGHRSLINAFQP